MSEIDYATSDDERDWPSILPPPAYLRRAIDEPLATQSLNDEQREAIAALSTDIATECDVRNYNAAQRAWALDEANLARFLRGWSWNVTEAASRVRLALDFRDAKRVWTLRADERNDLLGCQIRSGKMYRHGFDPEGRPIIYMRDRRNIGPEAGRFDDIVLHVVNMLERAADSMRLDKGVESWIFVIDMAGYRAAPGELSHNKNVIDIFLNQYPERLHRVFIVNAPWLFNAFWRLVSVVIPAKTKAKVCFCQPGSEELINGIGAETLETVLGGKCEAKFNYEEYWEEEKRQFDLRAERERRLLAGESIDSPKSNSERKTKVRRKKKTARN